MRSTLFLLLFLSLFLGCKKGADDPEISFRSRKSRLAGEWRMISGEVSLKQDTYSDLYMLDGTDYLHYVTFVGGTPTIYTGKYSMSMTIKKNHTFDFSEIFTGGTLKGSGTWSFNSGVGKAKSKEIVMFYLKDLVRGSTWGGSFFNQSSGTFSYSLVELRNDKVVMNASGLFYSNNNVPVKFAVNYVFQQNSSH